MSDFYERLLDRVRKSSGEIVKVDDGTIKIWLVEEDSAELLADIENPVEAKMLFKFLVTVKNVIKRNNNGNLLQTILTG